MSSRVLVFVLLVLALALAACGSPDGDAEPAPQAERTAEPTAAATPEPTPEEGSGAGPGEEGAQGECSAASLPPEPPDQELPPAVAGMREDIVRAAVACDFDELQALAAPGGFTFSYGVTEGAADFWREQEEAGEKPLAILVGLLALPPAQTAGETHVWPAAHAHRPTDRDWEELESIYDAEQIAQLKQAESYLGHRVGIGESGDWLYFVAGD